MRLLALFSMLFTNDKASRSDSIVLRHLPYSYVKERFSEYAVDSNRKVSDEIQTMFSW
jgi:hypothetical protein